MGNKQITSDKDSGPSTNFLHSTQSSIATDLPYEFLKGPIDIRSLALTGIFVILLFHACYFAAPILIPVVIALLLNLLFAPLVRLFAALGLPQVLGASVVLLTIVSVLVGASLLLAEPAQRWIVAAPKNFEEIEKKLRTLRKPIEEIQEVAEQVDQATQPVTKKTQMVILEKQSLTSVLLSGTPDVLAGFAVVLVLLFFLLASGDSVHRKIVMSVPKLQDKKRVLSIIRDIERDISYYLITITVINVCLGGCVAFAFWWLNVPNAILWGAMVALFNFAPYFGAGVSALIITTVGLLSFDNMLYGLLAPGIFLILTVLEGQFITPLVLGRRLSISPVAIFIAMLFWGWLWGIAGALIAIPLLMSFKIVCENIKPLQPIAIFLSP